jgi:hypothetical protein
MESMMSKPTPRCALNEEGQGVKQMNATNKVTFLPAYKTLANGETVTRGQLVEYYCDGSARPYHAVIVDWSESGKTVTIHTCCVSFYEDGTERIKLHTTDGRSRDVIRKFRFRAGRKGADVCFRKDLSHLHFKLED